jgi:hypothetical protein
MAKRTIHTYDQANDARWYAGEIKPHLVGFGTTTRHDFEPTSTSKGVCYGLAIWWIIKSANNINFWDWMPGPGPQVAEIKKLFQDQKGMGTYDFERFEAANTKITTDTRLTRQNEILMMEGTGFKHTGYYYISLRGKFGLSTSESGHAIAAYINPGGVCRYFDPNFGEYETDTLQETLQELGTLVRGYNISGIKIYWCCWN